jgi:PPOX class probable F420-dependent enzyme
MPPFELAVAKPGVIPAPAHTRAGDQENGDDMPAIPSSHRDLLDGQFATLGTVGPDGRPQLTEVWFLADGDTVGISLTTARQKTKNLLANPAVSLFLLDLANPYRYLEIRGDAEISPDDDYSFADRIGAKYNTDLRDRDRPGDKRVIVAIKPSRVNTWGG